MFDIGWTELLVIACVAIIVVGPKDLPRMLRTLGQTIGKMRKLSREFQSTFNDALREAEQQADIADMKKHVEEAANFNPLGDIKKSIEEEAVKNASKPKAASTEAESKDPEPVVAEKPSVAETAEKVPVDAGAKPVDKPVTEDVKA
ncbi:MAG: Sec-independent protein translocase protein TatB [Roseibium sp.]|uniref:Sec-independent protein translocase protein TatB n=1 Tax=Roseibium sp. TaxID=1936156 RepID=UPI00260580FB|nr:Sec-independent protein translocase protein TatB [Roseibium sp.]MCV0425487.1 Sec-independent protein translocase protein TatB [Roseibium sp.]